MTGVQTCALPIWDEIGDRADLGGFRIDVERHPDDHGAEVERARHRRRNRHQRERGALVWTGEVGAAPKLQGVGAGAGFGRDTAESARGPTARARDLGRPALTGGGRDGLLRAVRDAGQFAGQTLRQGDVDDFELLLAVAACDVDVERRVGAAFAAVDFRFVQRSELPLGQRFRTGPTGRIVADGDRGAGRLLLTGPCPWFELAGGRGLADRRAGEDVFAGTEVQADLLERNLRQTRGLIGELPFQVVVDFRGQVAGRFVGLDAADETSGDALFLYRKSVV